MGLLEGTACNTGHILVPEMGLVFWQTNFLYGYFLSTIGFVILAL